MDFSVIIKDIRQHSYMSQQEFANELGVSFSTVNRWETGKAVPNYKTMKVLVSYCIRAKLDYDALENVWKETKNGTDAC